MLGFPLKRLGWAVVSASRRTRCGCSSSRSRAATCPLILGIVVLVTTAILLFNLIVDLLYPLLDPRVRHTHGSPARSPGRARRVPQPESTPVTAP